MARYLLWLTIALLLCKGARAAHKDTTFLYAARETVTKTGQFLAAFRVEKGGRLRPVPLWVNIYNVPFINGAGALIALPAKRVLFMEYSPGHAMTDTGITNIAQFRILPNGKLRYETTYGLGRGAGGLTFYPSGKVAYFHVNYQGDMQKGLPAPQQGRIVAVRVTPQGDLVIPRIWEPGRLFPAPVQIVACGSYSTVTRISPAGNLLCTGDTDGNTRLFTVSHTGRLSARPVAVFRPAMRRPVPVYDVAFMPDGRHVFAVIAGTQIVQMRRKAAAWMPAVPSLLPLPDVYDMAPCGSSALLAKHGTVLSAFRVSPTGGLTPAATLLSPAYYDTGFVVDTERRRAYVTYRDARKHLVIGMCQMRKDGVPHLPFVPVIRGSPPLSYLTLVRLH